MSNSFSHKKFYCLKPFQEISIDLNGQIKICCDNWLLQPTLSLPSINQNDTNELWNSKSLMEFRASILDGSYRFCNATACPFLKHKAHDGPLHRGDKLPKWMKPIVKFNQTNLIHLPKIVHFNFDRSCNLACPSCRSQHFIEEQQKVSELLSSLKTKLPFAEELIITGRGDPFASATYRHFLENVTKEDFPSLKRIHLHTNALLWSQEQWMKLSPYARQLIKSADISVDASCADTYKLNRGGNFEILKKNLLFLKSIKGIQLSFLFVVQNNNYHEMIPFIKFSKEHGAKRILFTRLDNWGTFSSDQFMQRAVFLPSHPNYQDFIRTKRKLKIAHRIIFFRWPKINFGNI